MRIINIYNRLLNKLFISKSFNATKTTLTSIASRILNSSLNLISLPLTVNYLGKYEYGNWAIISSYAVFFAFADIGVGKGLVNRIASYDLNDSETIKTDLSSSLLIVLLLQFLFAIIFIVLYLLANQYYQDINFNFKYSICIIALTAILSLPLNILQGLLNGIQKGYIYNLSVFFSNIFTFFLLLLIIKLKLSIVWLTACYFLIPVITGYFVGFNYFRKETKYIPEIKKSDFKKGLKIVKEGSVFFIILIFSILGTSVDSIIINNFTTKENITTFAILQKFFSLVLLMQYFFVPYWPVITNAIVQRDFIWIKSTFRKIRIYSTFISIALPILIFFSLDILMKTFFKTEISIPLKLSLGLMFYAMNNSIGEQFMPIMMTKYLYKKLLMLTIIAGILSIFIKIYFLNYFGFEYIGFASLISYALFFTIPSYWFSSKFIKSLKS
jgi:O-antigen/teichoic acid export membrane protein